MNVSIADKLENVRKRIQKATISAGREANTVELLAVSKKKSADAIIEALKSVQTKFGESYLNEALSKQEQLESLCSEADYAAIEWHFVGPIQSNKTRPIAEHFHWVHGVDRLKIAKRLNDQRPANLPPLNVCIQINIDVEESKAGIALSDLDELADAVSRLPNLCLRGLMCIPKAGQSEQALSERFQQMRAALASLAAKYQSVDTLSMGMSKDLEQAVAHGSTIVRVGTDIFGERD